MASCDTMYCHLFLLLLFLGLLTRNMFLRNLSFNEPPYLLGHPIPYGSRWHGVPANRTQDGTGHFPVANLADQVTVYALVDVTRG